MDATRWLSARKPGEGDDDLTIAGMERTPSVVSSVRIGGNATKRVARLAIMLATCVIAVGYASAFMPGGAPGWAPWLLALGIPGALGGIMVLGAAREHGGVGRLAIPFALVIVILTVGFSLALTLPANEGAESTLWLGLPARAAIVVYGIGLIPVVVLPVAYALTFETQTLAAEDVERVRQLGKLRAENVEAESRTGEHEAARKAGSG
jgi:hypothetical protein